MEELNEGMNLLSEPDAAKRCDVSRITLLRAQVKFDAFSANVTRVDYCHDWRLTNELVNEYLWALRNVSLRRMKKHLIDNETVELRNRGQTITRNL